jgi:hypothetical protein
VDGEDVLVGTSTVTTRLLLRTAAERGGEAAVQRALRRVGLTDSKAQLHSVLGRVSYAVKLALFDAVAEEVGDPRIGLSLGSAAMTDPALKSIRALIRALGSPAAVLGHASRVCGPELAPVVHVEGDPDAVVVGDVDGVQYGPPSGVGQRHGDAGDVEEIGSRDDRWVDVVRCEL